MPQPIDRSALSHIHLAKFSDDHFTLSNPNDTTHVISFSTTELRKYIDYDRRIRSGNVTAIEPSGYEQFANFFNDPD